MARYRDDGEVQIDNSTNGHFRIAFQWLIVIAAFNVGTLLMSFDKPRTDQARNHGRFVHVTLARASCSAMEPESCNVE
jgi:hypothetical protein